MLICNTIVSRQGGFSALAGEHRPYPAMARSETAFGLGGGLSFVPASPSEPIRSWVPAAWSPGICPPTWWQSAVPVASSGSYEVVYTYIKKGNSRPQRISMHKSRETRPKAASTAARDRSPPSRHSLQSFQWDIKGSHSSILPSFHVSEIHIKLRG
jgi:hypothetical protein